MLTGGASAVYGSDAVAGVVNIIYKKNFEGVAFEGQYGGSAESDDQETQFGLTFGTNTADGRGNIMVHIGYTDQGAVMSADRSVRPSTRSRRAASRRGRGYVRHHAPFYSSFAPQGRFFTTNHRRVVPDGSFTYEPRQRDPVVDTTECDARRHGFNRRQQPHDRRADRALPVRDAAASSTPKAIARSSKALMPRRIRLRARAVSAAVAADIYRRHGQMPVEFTWMASWHATRSCRTWCSITPTDDRRRRARDFYFPAHGRLRQPRQQRRSATRSASSVASKARSPSDKWQYEGFYAFGQTKEAQTSGGQVNVLNFRSALEAIADADDVDGDGNTTEAICRDANARAQGCVPVNVFGYNSMSPAAVNYIQAPGSLATFTSQRWLGASLTGDVFDLPAGPFGDRRWCRVSRRVQQQRVRPADAGWPQRRQRDSADGRRVRRSRGVPRSERADPQGTAVRRSAVVPRRASGSDYSTVGNTHSWNAGLEWAPIPSLRFRATRALVDSRAEHQRAVLAAEPDIPDWPGGSVRGCHGDVE